MSKQKRKAHDIENGYEKSGVSGGGHALGMLARKSTAKWLSPVAQRNDVAVRHRESF